jgi:hypothetical protein
LEFDLHEQFTLYMPGTLLRAWVYYLILSSCQPVRLWIWNVLQKAHVLKVWYPMQQCSEAVTLGKCLDHEVSDLINELIYLWIHNLMTLLGSSRH